MVLQKAGDCDNRQKEEKSISLKGKAPELGIGHDHKDHDKEQDAADDKKADVGAVNKKVFIPSGKIFCPSSESVFFNSGTEKRKRVFPEGFLIHLQTPDQGVLQLVAQFLVVSVESQSDDENRRRAYDIREAHHRAQDAENFFPVPFPCQAVDQNACHEQKTAHDIRLCLSQHHDRTHKQ